MNVESLPPDHVWARPLEPAVEQLRLSLANALGNWPTRCEVETPDLSLIVQPLDDGRFIVVGRRLFSGLDQPKCPSDRPFIDADQWEVGLVRYYGKAWATGGLVHGSDLVHCPELVHAAETILDDFAPAVFVREWHTHHCER